MNLRQIIVDLLLSNLSGRRARSVKRSCGVASRPVDRLAARALFVLAVFAGWQGMCVAQVLSLSTGSSLIGPYDLTPPLAASLQAMGGRLQSPGEQEITLIGTVTDSSGTRNAQITIQAPGLLAYREGSGRAVTFDGSSFNTKSSTSSSSDKAVEESFLAHFPDSIFLQLARGGSLRRIGTHFRNDNGKSKSYSGPLWTVYGFSPKQQNGLAWGTALQEDLFIAFDEQTGLINDVRVVLAGPGTQVTETQVGSWAQQNGQWYPGEIVRIENGAQTLSFQTLQAIVGAPLGASAFQP